LGAGVQKIGDAVDTSGTCECITPLFPAIPETLDFQKNNFACVPYLEDRGFVTYAYNISAGSVVRWYRDALGYHLKEDGKSIYDILNETSPIEPTCLMVLPFLQGMGGTPDVDPNMTGLIAGITTQTRLPDIYRAILEGITFEMRYNMERLKEGNVHIQQAVIIIYPQISVFDKIRYLRCRQTDVLRREKMSIDVKRWRFVLSLH